MKSEKDELMSESVFLTALEAAQLLHISTSHAYKVIHRLNQELKAQGYLTIAGRISRDYLMERTVGKKPEMEAQQDGCL